MLAALWTAAFSTACRIGVPSGDGGGSSVAIALFGQARHAFGLQFYETADRYFHRGVPHQEERALSGGFYETLGRAITPVGHMHLAGSDVKEMLPWLWLSLKIDPDNIETRRVAAFWLVQELGRPDLARQVLKEAVRAHPYDYQVELDLGRLALREGRREDARRAFAAALAFWPKRQGVDEELAVFERADLLTYMALLDEIDGKPGEAAARLEEVHALCPKRAGIADRAGDLRASRPPAVPAATMWAEMIRRHSSRMTACHREDCHEHGHEHGASHGEPPPVGDDTPPE